MQTADVADIFSLDTSFQSPLFNRLFHMFRPALERVLGFDRLNELYSRIKQLPCEQSFFHAILQAMEVRVEIDSGELLHIPQNGAVVVAANHPFGGIEGIVLGALLHERRPDVRMMANYVLGRIPELRSRFIFVDPFGGESAQRANIRPLKESLQWLRNGGALGVFPAGEVAHGSLHTRTVEEGVWSGTVARLATASDATIVPVWFDGANSLLFQALGLLHPRLRTAMLIREFVGMQQRSITVRIGSPIAARSLAKLGSDSDIAEYIRTRTLMLGKAVSVSAMPRATDVVLPPRPNLMDEEISALPPQSQLVECGEFVVYEAGADTIPNVLHEIGRLREITFRGTGEGTGRSIDLDKFDRYYRHIFVWNRQKREVVGAYRLGQTDVILRFFGKKGIYTTTLFDFDDALLERMQPALEMGRSFVRPEYQKAFQPLLLLWKGIGAFIVRNPQYRTLFGPVSIAASYQPLSRRLIASFLRHHHFMSEEAQLVQPKRPFAFPESNLCEMALHDLSSLVLDIEGGEKCIPILLKHYLKLGGKLLGFNIDPKFNNALDGLIVVDLADTDVKVLERYMGSDGASQFLAFHGKAKIAGHPSPTPHRRPVPAPHNTHYGESVAV